MKGAIVLESPRVSVATMEVARTCDDGQEYVEIYLEREVPAQPPLPAFRAWLPLSPKSLAELRAMGVEASTAGPLSLRRRPFLIDIVSVACSDEESHGAEAQRLFVRNPRKVT